MVAWQGLFRVPNVSKREANVCREETSRHRWNTAGYGIKRLRMDCGDNVGIGLGAAGAHSNLQRLGQRATSEGSQSRKVGRMSL